MSNVWIYKFDGTIQCDKDAPEISLQEMRSELNFLINSKNIISMEKRQRPMVRMCGMPTGLLNCYEITQEGWTLLSNGIVGKNGFQRLDEGPQESPENVNLGRLIGSLTASNPQTVQELVGHQLRVYKTGDALTLDWRPERCNIEVSDLKKIVKIWFG